jgi:hypothetical protein
VLKPCHLQFSVPFILTMHIAARLCQQRLVAASRPDWGNSHRVHYSVAVACICLKATGLACLLRTASFEFVTQNGELAAEPSARRLAAEAARVAGTKLVRGINTGIKVAQHILIAAMHCCVSIHLLGFEAHGASSAHSSIHEQPKP